MKRVVINQTVHRGSNSLCSRRGVMTAVLHSGMSDMQMNGRGDASVSPLSCHLRSQEAGDLALLLHFTDKERLWDVMCSCMFI